MPSPLIETVGKEWRNKVFDATAWRATKEERPGGEAEGFWVTNGELRGYLKPSKSNPPMNVHPRAAHEKIAADLAFDLRLQVSPAVLVDGRACGGGVEAAAVSLVVYREVHKWSHATSTPAAQATAMHILRSRRQAVSAMMAFDTWLANSDRNNGGNMLIGSDGSLSEPIFCDFSNTMIHSQWASGTFRSVTVPQVLLAMRDVFDRDAALEVCERIKAYPVDSIFEVVSRVPETHLLPEHRTIICDALVQRRAMVSDAISAFP